MLKIRKEVICSLGEAFLESSDEQGFILGSKHSINMVDCCAQIPAVRAGMYYYEPYPEAATEIIRRWAAEDICFSGFIHSHLINKTNLSEPDIDFANRLIEAYALPVLWFGVYAIGVDTIRLQFYSVRRKAALSPTSTIIFDGI